MADRNSEIRPPVSHIRVAPFVADRWGIVHRVTQTETAILRRLSKRVDLRETRV